MKLMWFHLLPCTDLPENLGDKHPLVWVDIHSSLFDPQRARKDCMDEFEYVAQCGFDAVCVNEHRSNGRGLMPSRRRPTQTAWRAGVPAYLAIRIADRRHGGYDGRHVTASACACRP